MDIIIYVKISTWVFCLEEHLEKFLESDIFGILETEGVTEIGAPLYKVSSYLDFWFKNGEEETVRYKDS